MIQTNLKKRLLAGSFIGVPAILMGSVSAYAGAPAMPTGGSYVAGQGHIGSVQNGTMVIRQQSQRGVINWQGFSIGKDGKVVIENGTGATLNRVTSAQLSRIAGSLKSTGSTYLINPHGIIISSSGKVITGGGFVASTRNISNKNFMAGGTLKASGNSNGDVINDGQIIAKGGNAILIGHNVKNDGSVTARHGVAALVAGNKVYLREQGGPDSVYVAAGTDAGNVTNAGKIRAAAAELASQDGNVYALAGNHKGQIQATGTKTIKGQIWLDASHGTVVADGKIVARDASGGTVAVTAHNIRVASKARIKAGGKNGGGLVTIGAAWHGHAEANSTRISSGAKIDAGNSVNGGHIDTSGHYFSMGSASIRSGHDGTWMIDPIDLTIDAAAASSIDSSLNAGTNVVEQTTALATYGSGTMSGTNGDITVSAPLTWTGTGNLTFEVYGNLNINAAITGAGSLTAVAGGAINLNAAVKVNGATLSGASFVNTVGANGLTVNTGTSWTIYTPNQAVDTYDGLTPNYIQYSATAPVSSTTLGGTVTAGTLPAGTGNGFLYAVSPKVSVSLTGTVAKTYDGTTAASIDTNLSAAGLINGDTVTGTGAYATANAGSNIAVSITGLSFQSSTGLPVYGYQWTNSNYTATVGTISPKQLTASIIGNPTKTYDQTTNAALTSANFSLSGFVGSEGATVTQNSGATYASASAGTELVTASLTSTDFSANSGTNLSNYVLPTTATGNGTINKAPLDLLGVTPGNKVYDGTNIEPLNLSSASLYGVDTGDQVSLVTTGATGTFSQSNVGSNLPVALTGVSLTGAQAGDYTLVAPPGFVASITPKALTISGVSATNKVYDGTTADQLSFSTLSLNGVVSGDTVNLSSTGATGNFVNPNAGSNIAVDTSGFTISGASAGNYSLVQPAGLLASITPRPLNIVVVGNPTKTYDGSTRAVVSSSNLSISGFVSGQGASLPQNGGATYASADAGSQLVTVTFKASDFQVNSGTLMSNYIVPGSATGAGTINTAPLQIAIVGDPTKTYDGSTNGTLTSSNYQVTGLVGGQSVTINQPIGTYANANAGIEGISAFVTLANVTAGSGTNLANYSLPANVSGYGTILKQALTGDISAAIIGNPTKTYDGSTTISLSSADFTLSGFQSGQGATINQNLTGNFATPNAGVQPISVALTASDFTANSGTNLANYTLPTVAYGPGTITPAILSGTIFPNPQKTYDTTTNVDFAPNSFTLTGLVGSDTINLTQEAVANYASANAGNESVTTSLTAPDFVAGSGTDLADYVLPASINGTGTINKASLNISNVAANSKVYDGTAAATLSDTTSGLIGVDSGDTVNLVTTGANASFNQSNVGSGLAVNANGFTISGASAGNYFLNQPVGLTANITPKALTISGVTVSNKNYDGTTSATLNDTGASLSGVLTGDTVNLGTSGATAAFDNANAGTGIGVSVSGFTISGSSSGNYTLVQPQGETATINKATLTAQIVNNPTKTYDGTTSATLTANNYTLSGFASGQGASVPQSATANYANANAGSEQVNSTLAFSDFNANSGTFLGNYILPTTATGTGTINQAKLTAAIIGNPTKVYDTTTTATLTGSNYQLSGFVGSQGATVTQTVGAYANPNVGSSTVTAALTGSDFTANSGTDLGNYILPTNATGTGAITPQTVYVSGLTANNKVYDGTTTATVSSYGSLTGVYAQDASNVSLNTSGSTANFASQNVGNGITVTVNGLSITGSQAYDYVLNPTSVTTTANITPKTLSLVKVEKVYDSNSIGPTTASSYTISGVVGSDQVYISSSTLSSKYGQSSVGSGIIMNVYGLALGGAQASDYYIPSYENNVYIGTITPAPLYITGVQVNSKQYDGTTAATLNNANDAFSGLYTGNSVTLVTTNATGTFTSKNVGNNIPVNVSGFNITGTNAQDYTLFQPTGVTGNITPDTLTLSLSKVTKVYDGTTNLPGADVNYSLNGVYSGDQVAVNASGLTGSYLTSNVGTGIDVSISSITLTGAQAGNYTIASSVTSDPIGTITPRPITGSIIGNPTKTYDGSNSATLTGYDTLSGSFGNYSFSGFVAGQGMTVTQTAGTYASSNAGSETVTANLNGFVAADPGTVLSNYSIPASVQGAGYINKAGLIVTGVTATNKVYDYTNSDPLNLSNAGLSGIVTGDQVSLVTSGSTGTFANPNVGNNIGVTAAGFSITGAQASNYTLTQPTGLTANITPATLNVTNVEKVYDSTTSLAGSAYTLSGIYGNDNVLINTSLLTGSYAVKNVGGSIDVTLNNVSLTGAQANDYTIASSFTNDPIGTITPATLTISGITGTSKVYDGSNLDPLNYAGEIISGIKGNDQVTAVNPANGTLNSPNVGSNIGVNIGTITLAGTDSGNYIVSQQTSTTGNVTPAPLTLYVNGPTKTYDGTTNGVEPGNLITLMGFVNGQGGNVANLTGNYASANAGDENFSAPISMTDVTPLNGSTLLSNYNLTTSQISVLGYINQKQLSVSIIGNPSKVYDGTTSATLSPTNYDLTGFVGSQSASITQTSGTYVNANAGSEQITTGLTSSDFVAGTGTDLANYILPTSAAGTGTIDQKLLTASIIGNPVKVYDGTTAVSLGFSNYSISGFVGSEGATVTQTNGVFSSPNAGAETVSANLSPSDFSANSGTNLGNYILPISASGNGAISQKLLFVSFIGSPTKVYDGTTNSVLTPLDFSLNGFVSGQGGSITQTVGTYSSANAGNGIGVTANISASDYSFNSGTLGSNYVLQIGRLTAIGNINPKPLNVNIIGAPTKIYDGTTNATLTSSNYSILGFVGTQGATITQTSGQYSDANVGIWFMSASLKNSDFTANPGTDLNNYVLPPTASGGGQINPKPLSISIIGNPTKTYNGSTNAVLGSNNYDLTGFVGSQGATVSQTIGSYASANAGPETVTASLTSNNYTANSGTELNNYILPTTATGLGTINKAIITGFINGSTDKTYDGTTTATVDPANYALYGFVKGQGATINKTTGNYYIADVGNQALYVDLGISDFTANSGTDLNNYSLPTQINGNGFISPAQLSITIGGTPTKTYDGTNVATLNSGDYTISGFVNGQGATVTQNTGTYASANASNTDPVTVSLTASDLLANPGTNLYDYTIPSIATGNGVINPATLIVSIIGNPTKTYDGTTSATLSSSNYSISGFIGNQSATITQTNGNYVISGAGQQPIIASLAKGDYSAANGTDLANYTLPTGASGLGTIERKQLTASIVSLPTKTYDGTATANLNSTDYLLSGFVGTQSATVDQPVGTYSNPNVGLTSITANLASGAQFTAANNTDLGNYILPTTASGAGYIAPRALTVKLIGVPTKTYDGTTTATTNAGDFSLTGFVNGQGGSVNQTIATYSSPNAGTQSVSVDLTLPTDFTANVGTDFGNYTLPTGILKGTGQILPKQITVSIIGNPVKTYDGNTLAALGSSNFAISGTIGGQSLTINQLTGNYANANAGSEQVTSNLNGFYKAGPNTNLANYILPDFAQGAGTIDPREITGSIIGNPTKVYDGNSNATLGSGNYALVGFVGGQGATITHQDGTYAGPQAGNEVVSVTLGTNDFTANAGTNLANYILPLNLVGNGSITPKALTITGLGVGTKIFNGKTLATLTGQGTLEGIVPGDQVYLTGTPIANFIKAQVGNGITVFVTGYGLDGNSAGNYELSLPVLTGRILPANLIEAVAGNTNDNQYIDVAAARSAETGMSYIPFPAPDGVSTRNVDTMAPLPVIINNTTDVNQNTVSSNDGTETYSTEKGEPIMTDPEQILLQGSKTKKWTIKFNTAMNRKSN